MNRPRFLVWLSATLCAISLPACTGDPSGRENETGVTSLGSGETETTETGDSGMASMGTKLDLPDEDQDLPSATTEDCVAESIDPEVALVPVDIVLVVDTSASMASAIGAVETSINVDFVQILEVSGIDYRVIVLGAQTDTSAPICISSPLSDTDCNPPPPVPAINDRYKHYDAETGSVAFLSSIVNWYSIPDKHGLAPNGYQDFLRPEAAKVILGMTDGEGSSSNPADGDAFDNALLNLQPPAFGTPGNRGYKFHLIVEIPPNNPVDQPYLSDDPIIGNAGSLEQVAILSDGWRFPLSETETFPLLFQEIADDVVTTTPIACEFPIPEAPMGEIDPNTIEIDYLPNMQPPPIAIFQVVDLAACEPNAFYIANETVILCPETCAVVQADANAKLDIRYGCDVGFDPQG